MHIGERSTCRMSDSLEASRATSEGPSFIRELRGEMTEGGSVA